MEAGMEEILDEFELASEPGNERLAFKRVAGVVAATGSAPIRSRS